ncbi:MULTISPECIES: helix-turn-helix transcriptional regulator [unclassified Mycobacterium]|uniref:helix-turn-helix domain-containing protein n=1 Tax=unclassified Mycobacterium TaxID=2642494 RepID=UPI0009EEB34A|nr:MULTISPECIES: helix-turn-helix transcriptional regulator [unclassified Mycobacterium]
MATAYFSERLRHLMAGMGVRDLDNGQVRRLTPLRLQRMLQAQAPELPLSQSQFYRYVNGEATPDIAVVYELAILFGVPPTYFIPDRYLPE